MGQREALRRCAQLLEMVGIADGTARLRDHPHQLSGGMRQRVMIAMMLGCQPDILIADEPTTALDVTIQAQIVALIKELRATSGLAIIWVTHDLSVVAGLADRVMVMYAGFVVEEATVEALFDEPRHPYTLGLLGALPSIQAEGERRLVSIRGAPPDLAAIPNVCPFHPRCQYAIDRCLRENPALAPVPNARDARHRVACWVDVREKR
jgi:oligopeptide/dipeptide ABC transporter ATP-binding protein